jgi:sugar phosphate isomerase/epimerase
MKLGFVSAILPEYTLEQVLRFAHEAGFSSVELMCWPPGKSERRYAGVTHFDATDLSAVAIDKVRDLLARYHVSVSGLGYYPNPLAADRAEAAVYVAHLRAVIDAAAALEIGVVNTFVGREPALSVEANWPRFLEVWRPLIAHAEDKGIKVGIENCPMLFTANEWPGGKNLATTPAIWRKMFDDIPSPNFGLNFDPSHFIWQQIDYITPLGEFKDRIFHVHAKDARIDRGALDQHGVLSYPNLWHTPKIPGLGDVRWGQFFGALTDAGYAGHIAIEVEDRSFEGSLESRLESLVISRRYLLQYCVG